MNWKIAHAYDNRMRIVISRYGSPCRSQRVRFLYDLSSIIILQMLSYNKCFTFSSPRARARVCVCFFFSFFSPIVVLLFILSSFHFNRIIFYVSSSRLISYSEAPKILQPDLRIGTYADHSKLELFLLSFAMKILKMKVIVKIDILLDDSNDILNWFFFFFIYYYYY